VFIVLSSFSTLIGGLQNVMVRSMPLKEINATLDSSLSGHVPATARAIFSHFQLIVLALFVVSLLTLIASVGLLHRRNWARVLFIGILGLGTAYVLGGLFLQQSMLSTIDANFRTTTPQQFASMFAAMRVVVALFSLGIATIFVWILVKLCSASIREEFLPSGRAA
jgi:hypothetical protein